MKTGLFVGLNKGFIVQKPKTNPRKVKPSYSKGRIGTTHFDLTIHRKESQNDQRNSS